MPPRRGSRVSSSSGTQLAQRRLACGLTQEDMARACGTSTSTYARLEKGKLDEVPLWLLNNCALALGVKLETLIEPQWREWVDRYGGQPEPPDPKSFWRKHPDA